MKRLFHILTTMILLGFVTACNNYEPVVTEAPEFTDILASDITYKAVVLKASFSETTIVKGGFIVSENGSANSIDIEAAIEGNTISATCPDLKPETEYNCYAYIVNSVNNRVESKTISFNTAKQPLPTDIIQIQSEFLKKWLLLRYDANSDGELSFEEGKAVDEIEVNTDAIESLTGIEHFPNISHLHAAGTIKDEKGLGQLSSVDLSQAHNCSQCYLVANKISSLSFPEDNSYLFVEVNYNELQEIDVSMLKQMNRLACSNNHIKALDCSGLDELVELHCGINPLESLVLDNQKLESITCNNTQLTTLDLTKCPLLNSIDCSNCPKLTSIIVSKSQAISTITKDPTATIIYHE